MQPHQFHIQRIDHMGLIAGMCKELGIATLLDSLVPNQSGNWNISFGETVVSMLLNGLGFNARTLHMFHTDKPLDKLIRPSIEPEHINDSVLGRVLDQLFELDGTEDSATLKSPMTDTHHNYTTKNTMFLNNTKNHHPILKQCKTGKLLSDNWQEYQ